MTIFNPHGALIDRHGVIRRQYSLDIINSREALRGDPEKGVVYGVAQTMDGASVGETFDVCEDVLDTFDKQVVWWFVTRERVFEYKFSESQGWVYREDRYGFPWLERLRALSWLDFRPEPKEWR